MDEDDIRKIPGLTENITSNTIWDGLTLESEELQYLNLSANSIWNEARDREIERTLTREELKRVQEGQASRETIAKDRFWRMGPDGIAFPPPTKPKAGLFCILEYKRMSDVTDNYFLRAKLRAENQYESLRRALSRNTIQRQGWMVGQVSFIVGARFLNEQNLRKNLKFLRPSPRD